MHRMKTEKNNSGCSVFMPSCSCTQLTFSVACGPLTRPLLATTFSKHSGFTRKRSCFVQRRTRRSRIHLCASQGSATSDLPSESASSATGSAIPANLSDGAAPLPSSPSKSMLSPFLRKALSGFAGLGVLETAYLTYVKVFSSPGAICATQGCLDVLAGPYSAIFGIPLSVYGTLGYGAFLYLSAWPLFAKEKEYLLDADEGTTVVRSANEEYEIRDAATRPLMLALSSVMFVFSSYLMALLVFVIKNICPYCVFSATLALVIFTLTAVVGRAVADAKTALSIVGGAGTMALLAAGATFFIATPGGLQAQIPSEPQSPPEITQRSTAETMRLAKKLEKRDAKMYGAYWCTHCYDQKQRFGARAFSKVKYIECDQYGKNTQYKMCRQKRIPGYPTWEIGGKLYPGEIVLEDLEKLADEP